MNDRMEEITDSIQAITCCEVDEKVKDYLRAYLANENDKHLYIVSTRFRFLRSMKTPTKTPPSKKTPTKTPESTSGGRNEGNSAANTELGNRMRNIGFISLTARTTGTAWLGAFRNGPATAMLVGQALDAVSARYNCQVIGHTFRATWLDSHVSNPPQDAVVLTRTEDGENQDEQIKDNEEQA
mmetsp:Transcript_35403/g.79236  ORF Transcript_35403/g.79236 Transcript_35403/m.79236 type:complete len:183 (+) Transcript_35403:138-686(+)|eukprot:CAMPEP_0206381428 /NCGR_PEP_ID=MMETSP0294-20121207/12643_1 /ASSEMBLY_ACC=CAM_ASM_000327 /TAXON_ID=39354 /ORGANISM="Heterosigma akashiwo, Strain CCMP2393" /LENGTH=182 /DNA_ID=CAMNT_0053830885 /DNA_START=171 /DNA_END=719 /DNA_ORIENTATION=+